MSKQYEIVEETKRYANAQCGRTPVSPSNESHNHPLVPLFIAVPDGAGGEITEVRECDPTRHGESKNIQVTALLDDAHAWPAKGDIMEAR